MKASEIEGVLTLEQLKQMDGQRVLIPETSDVYGGFGIVDVAHKRVYSIVGLGLLYGLGLVDEALEHGGLKDLEFSEYEKTWIALADKFGILDVTQERRDNDV